VLLLWRTAFCLFSVKQRATFQLSLFDKICHESSVRYHSGGSMELNACILLLALMVYL
jgi:hypothetical protein